MKAQTVNTIVIAILIGALFFVTGYNNTRIKQLTEKIDQYHVVK